METRRRKSAILFDRNISYQTLPSPEPLSRTVQDAQPPDIIRQKSSGTLVAPPPRMQPKPEQQELNFISNAGELKTPDDKEVPNAYEFEIIRLRRRIDELECVVRDRDSRVVSAIAMLENELSMYRSLMHDHIAETHDGVRRRMLKIEVTLEALKAKGSKFYPPMEVPKRLQKK